jgi:hypothetical protein
MCPFLIRVLIGANYTTGSPAEKGPRFATRKTDSDIVLGKRRMKTGQDVIVSGLYASDCCGEEEMLEKDTCFPRCAKCKGLSTWEAVDLPSEQAA